MSLLLQSPPAVQNNHARAALALAAVVWFALLCLSAVLTRQGFVADETGYLLPTLYGWSAANYEQWAVVGPYPSYLYFWIYSFLPSDNLHTNAKILNAVFIVATALPAYVLARRYLAVPFAAAFAALVMLSPISSFVFYVMPEPMYLFGFWLVVVIVITALDKSTLLAAVAGGASIGALSLIKPHAFALTIGACTFFVLRDRLRWRGAMAAGALFSAYYCTRVALAYPLTGQWTWSVTGSVYAKLLGGGQHIDLSAMLYNLAGHVCAVMALVAVPLAITFSALVRDLFTDSTESKTRSVQRLLDLGLLAGCVLAAMIAMTVYFSQSVYQLNPVGEDITRLHGRYYLYALPLFGLVTIALWQNQIVLGYPCPRWGVIALCAAALAAAIVVMFVFRVGPVDFPDLALASGGRAQATAGYSRYALVVLLAVPCAVTAFGSARFSTASLIVGVTLWSSSVNLVTSGAIFVYTDLVRAFDFSNPVDAAFFDASDRSGLRRLAGRSDGIVIGSPASGPDLARAMLYLHCLCTGRIAPDGTAFKDSDFPARAHWAVMLPGVSYIGSAEVTQLGSVSVVWRP